MAVMLMPQDAAAAADRSAGRRSPAASQADGTFAIANVPPGRYIAIARAAADAAAIRRTAMQTVVVNGQNIDGVTLVLQPGVTLSGNITVESSGTPSPTDYSVFRVDVPDVDPLPVGGGHRRPRRRRAVGGGGRVEKNGSFTLGEPAAGPALHPRHRRRRAGRARPSGRSKTVTDRRRRRRRRAVRDQAGTERRQRQRRPHRSPTELSGTVTRRAEHAASAALTVIAFSTEPQYWRAQSRRIATSRSSQTGGYPDARAAGRRLLRARGRTTSNRAEWFDPAYLASIKDKATQVTIREGETKTLDLRGAS